MHTQSQMKSTLRPISTVATAAERNLKTDVRLTVTAECLSAVSTTVSLGIVSVPVSLRIFLAS